MTVFEILACFVVFGWILQEFRISRLLKKQAEQERRIKELERKQKIIIYDVVTSKRSSYDKVVDIYNKD